MAKVPKKKAAKARVQVIPEPGLVADVQNKRRPRRKEKPVPIMKDEGSWTVLALGIGCLILLVGAFCLFK